MDWQEIGRFTLTKDWQYTEQVTSKDFKVVYLDSPLSGANSAGLIALLDLPSDSTIESTEVFRPQRITSYSISEIISFPNPPRGWDYRLGVKQLVFSKSTTTNIRVKIYMPVVDLTPDQPVINPTIATTKNLTSVGVGATNAAIRLLPVNAGQTRKHATFYNPGTSRNLYIDTDSTINIASALGQK